MATLRSTPDDFLVEEIPLYQPSGEGPFVLAHVEKRLRNSDDVAAEIARELGLEPRAVGYAGRKDRRAVTRQWFSVRQSSPAAVSNLELEGVTILEALPHRHALRPGDLVGNRFRITLREVQTAMAPLQESADRLRNHGVPNRFGRQRYGRHGDNAEIGRRVLTGERVTGHRRREGFYLSALQSLLFDEVVRRRSPNFGQLMQGDLAWHHATATLRPILRPSDFTEAAAAMEISPSGPILGHKMRAPQGAALQLEKAAAADLDLPWIYDLPRLRRHHLSGSRRPLRIPASDLTVEPMAEATTKSRSVVVSVVLPPGSYVSVLLEELFPEDIEEPPTR